MAPRIVVLALAFVVVVGAVKVVQPDFANVDLNLVAADSLRPLHVEAIDYAKHNISDKSTQTDFVKYIAQAKIIAGAGLRETTGRHVPNKNVSLFCVAIVRPIPIELLLLRHHSSVRANVFACDDYLVISNTSFVPMVDPNKIMVIDTAFAMPNRDTFLTAWKAIFKHSSYARHDWVVKLELDTVFAPSRLQGVLQIHNSTKPAFVANIPLGIRRLGGPMEVFSVGAVKAMAADGLSTCFGLAKRGEDWAMDACMRALNIPAINSFFEAGCFGTLWQGFGSLADTSRETSPNICDAHFVAFHPFKNITNYERCSEIMSSAHSKCGNRG